MAHLLHLLKFAPYNDINNNNNNITGLACCTCAALPRQPTRVVLVQMTSSSIKLAWYTDAGEAVSFTVQYRPSRHTADTDRWMTVSGIVTTEHTVTDLQPYTEYQLRVVAVGSAGCSEPSDIVEGRTLRGSYSNTIVEHCVKNQLILLRTLGEEAFWHNPTHK